MRRISLGALAVGLLASSLLLLAGSTTRTGVLMDAMCGEKIASDQQRVQRHPVSCSLSDHCRKSGFGIVNEARFYKFDKTGDNLSLALLQKTSKKKNLTVKVTGDFSVKPVKVESIEETP